MTSWNKLNPTIRTTAETVCTPKQLEALKLWEDHLGYRRIAAQLHISESSARDRIHRALTAIDHTLEQAA